MEFESPAFIDTCTVLTESLSMAFRCKPWNLAWQQVFYVLVRDGSVPDGNADEGRKVSCRNARELQLQDCLQGLTAVAVSIADCTPGM